MKYLILINWSIYTIIILYFIDLGNPTTKLIERLYYLLSNISNNLNTLYFIYCLNFALE